MREPIEEHAKRGAELLSREVGGSPWRFRLMNRSTDGQAVFEYRSEDRTLIGKLAPDGSGARSFRLLEGLAAKAHDCLRVPQPLLYSPELNMLFTAQLVGAPCDGMPLNGADGRLHRIGQALRELHHCAIDFGAIKSLNDHVSELIRPAPDVLLKANPGFADTIQACLELLQARAFAWESGPIALLHRDFHLRQLFDDGTQIGVVDWDLSARGDPAFDVAYFAIYLANHYPTTESAPAVEAFLSGYGADEAIRSRLPVYACFNYLRRACRRYRLQDAGWREQLHNMLTALDRQLHDLT